LIFQDIAVTEQLVLYVRGVDPNTGEIFVRLFDLIAMKKADGESILAKVLESLHRSEVEFMRLIGVSSDGAGAMFGKYKGFCARLKQLQKFLWEMHCICHRTGVFSTFDWKLSQLFLSQRWP